MLLADDRNGEMSGFLSLFCSEVMNRVANASTPVMRQNDKLIRAFFYQTISKQEVMYNTPLTAFYFALNLSNFSMLRRLNRKKKGNKCFIVTSFKVLKRSKEPR